MSPKAFSSTSKRTYRESFETSTARRSAELTRLPAVTAALEKLVQPYKSITAHVYRHPVPAALGDDLAAWDAWLAQHLSAPVLATASLFLQGSTD